MDKNVQGDIQKLIDYSVDFAESLLTDSGEFFPFGVKVYFSGELKPVGYYDDDEFPESQKVIDVLSTVFEKELNGKEIRSYCIAYDVRVSNEDYPTPTDAILILLKHTDLDGELNYYYPYKLKEKLEIEFLEPWAVQK
ncbi:MAG: hypothetical protein JWQ14_3419 [Adhaeribacter sp.]|nr:hypothetical protein [Adhaeribacter sp.]